MSKKLFTILFFLAALTSGYSQLGKIHYIPPIAGQDVSDHMIYISTPSTGYINVTIKPIGGTRTDWKSRTVSNDDPWDFSTGTGRGGIIQNINTLNGVISNQGYIIESQGLTYVSFRFNSPVSTSSSPIYNGQRFHSGAYVSKAESAPGSRLRAATFTNTSATGGAQNFISILATEDNTKVTISDFPSGIEFTNNDLAGTQTSPLILPVLNKNETYILGYSPSDSNSNDIKQALIGALVTSEDNLGGTDLKPVVVVSGSIGGSLRNGSHNNSDYGLDQITDIDLLGSEYIFIKGAATNEIEKVILIADEDGTAIFKDGVDTGITLDEGEHIYYEGSDYSNGANMYISTFDPTTAPTSVPKKLVAYQGIGYGSSSGGDPNANQGLVYVPPLSCSSRGNIDNIPFINRIASNKMIGGTLTILTEENAVLEVYRQGVLIADNQGTSGVYDLSTNEKTVDGNSKYRTYFLLSQPSLILEDNIAVKSDKELYLGSSTYSSFGSGGSFYSGFVTDPQVQPDLTISPLGICISLLGVSNVNLTTSNSFDSYKWEKYDLSTSTWSDAPTDPSDPLSTNNKANYKPIEEGDYRLVGTLSCFPGKQYISETQIVSICPTDFDGDGIVDNIDLDLDNDGILNSIESSGNIKIDMSLISSPVLQLSSPFTTTANYTGAIVGSSTFTGDSDGNFTSEIIPAGSNEDVIYKINPIQLDPTVSANPLRINIALREDSSITHTYNADEEFTIRAISNPDNKNFTILDPGEKLLVNNGSGFVTVPPDGYSGRKIIFKYNDNPLDPTQTFSFYAYDIEGLEFTHNISSVASADSSFNGKFEILDYKLDTDADGDLDMYDWDSDDDGCNDVIESDVNYDNTTVKPRVNLDPNNDGIYGGLTYGTSGTDVIQYPDVDGRGRINDLIDATTGNYLNPPSDPVTSNPLYLDNTAPNVIFNTQPEDIQICQDGDDATFTIDVDPGAGYNAFYQWWVDKGTGNFEILLNDPATTPDTTSKDLTFLNVDSSMNGWRFYATVYSDGVLCEEVSSPAVLNVEATLPTAKAVDLSDPLFDENWIIKCDNGTDQYDGISSFDLSLIDDYIRDTQDPAIFEVSYFLDPNDALDLTKTGITNPTTFTNTPNASYDPNNPSTQTLELHVRVRNINSNCIADPMSFELTINTVPLLVTPTVDVNQCDVGIFNLTDQEDNLSSNYANEEFEYYDSTGILIDPINGLDPTNYAANGQNEIITVTIKTKPSLGTACINTTATINLAWSVTTLPAGYTLKDEYLVETDPDPKGQGQDGVETFDKSIFTTVQSDLITAEPAFSGKTFSFYRSQNDALTSSNKIDTTVDFATDEQTNDGFTFNTAENRWEQQIWIYIEDNVTTAIATCYGLYHIATVYVEKRPVFYDVTMQELCDEQTPLDMKSLFDTTSLFSEFTTDPTGTVTQDTSLFTVEYTYVDDTGAPKTLEPTLPSNFNTTDQTITVTLTNNSTNSALAAGVSSGTIEFKVYQQPVAYPSDPSVPGVYTFVECDDDNDGLAVGEEVFDMSSITTRLLTDISGTYAAQDPNDFDFEYSVAGTIITLGSDYTATTGDQIEVKITNPLYPVCEETITIDFIVNPLPSFDIDDTTVICLNLTQPVEIGTSNWNGAADPSIYTYSWTLDSDPSFSETTETIFPVKGGIYTVVVEDPITFCTQTKSITVTESDIASIDLDDDGDVTDTEYDHFIEVLDLTDDNTNTIKINNIADLGIGDYEFSLDNFNYQDDNEFTDLDPGVYTLYIRDKNSYYSYTYGCGILEVTVSVIGYKKYFTPNNDGINDKWKILGIRIDFNNASEIYIFNRYGKLLKQLDPITDGWDGTYLGKPMPATDYWFRVYLEDGREFKGHFSLIRGKY